MFRLVRRRRTARSTRAESQLSPKAASRATGSCPARPQPRMTAGAGAVKPAAADSTSSCPP